MAVNLDKIIKEQINNWINESFIIIEDEKEKTVNDKFTKKATERVKDAITQKFLNNDEHLMQKADEIGINPNYDTKEYIGRKSQIFKGLNISNEVTDKVKKVIEILRKATNSSGAVNGIDKMVAQGQTYGLSYNEIMRIKDFIDGQDLRYMYDKSINPANKKLIAFGNKVDKEGNLDDSEFDLNTITDADLTSWMKPDSRKNQYTEDEALIERKRGIITKYLMSEYGVQFNVPGFSLGNAKVKDALMINFTSAFRCPAWNECLVKHACYARSDEGRLYHNVKINNDKKHLMWEAAHNDPELMALLADMLRAYVVDYEKVSKSLPSTLKSLRKNNGENTKEFLATLGTKDKIDKLSRMTFASMPQELLDVIKNCTRVKDIRLNENGDFIGDWLIKAIDEMAGDFKLIDVSTAAYSCRHLNFNGIKNIIINASRINMEGPTIARYFYALPQKMYEAFGDTYAGMSIKDSFNAIQRQPQPLYSINANGQRIPNGHYYYKCPCGRTDFKISKSKAENKKINCYQCHLCYEQPDGTLPKGSKLFVFVKAHGVNANLLNTKREREIIRTVGVSKDYQLGLQDDGKAYANDDVAIVDDGSDTMPMENIKHKKQTLNENTNILPSLQTEAYNTITNNAISSINEHLGSISQISECKSNFFNVYNKLLKD